MLGPQRARDVRPVLSVAPRRGASDAERVFDEPMTTEDLLAAWRDATRAAELAERLAARAREAAKEADRTALSSEEVARLAEQAAMAAEHAAREARAVADRAALLARDSRGARVPEAEQAASDARVAETEARGRYHDAEGVAPQP